MRKIWSQRKDKDKRKSMLGALAYAPLPHLFHKPSVLSIDLAPDFDLSVVSIDDFHDDYTIGGIPEAAPANLLKLSYSMQLAMLAQTIVPPPLDLPISPISNVKLVLGLVRLDYDLRVVKSAWLNVIVNSHLVSDISEQSLKLCRAELKGSHLYLYKATSLNARSFRVDHDLPQWPVPVPGTPTPPTDSQFHHRPLASLVSQIGTPLLSEEPDLVPLSYDGEVPHPDLKADHTLSPEALVHTLLYAAPDSPHASLVPQLVHVLPLLPNFGEILRIVLAYLAVSAPDIHTISSRLVALFKNIDANFLGFLLKLDIAPHILKIIESLSHLGAADEAILALLDSFKQSMLAKQHALMSLVSSESTAPERSPLHDLSSSVFMNDINLFDLASAVSQIDLKFFSLWNCNSDKSLLLALSLNSNADFYKKNPLIFNNDIHIHYLSRLLVHHLFVETSGTSGAPIPLERKARLLEKWIDLGCLLDKSGNMSSWLGISSVILSQPVLRLTKVWLLVSPDYIKLLKNDWLPVLFELDRRHLSTDKLSELDSPNPDKLDDLLQKQKDSYHIMAPRGLGKIYSKDKVIPFFGDLTLNNTSYGTNIVELENIWKKINYSFSRWNEYLANLKNYSDVIKYNEDVLRRYDNMGFIFANESLNQVLYLGHNAEEKDLTAPAVDAPATPKSSTPLDLKAKLLRLIEINCDSTNLEKIMRLSLQLEPKLPEAYLKVDDIRRPSVAPIPEITGPPNSLTFKLNNTSSSNLSVHLTELSSSSIAEKSPTSISRPLDETNPSNRIPLFNNHYFRINLSKYDDTVTIPPSSAASADFPVQVHREVDKHNIIVDADLTFRIDDFVSDMDASSINNLDEVVEDDDDDVPGLGIDVDDILNSDKFNNFLISQANSPDPNDGKKRLSVTRKAHESIGAVSATDSERGFKYIPKYATIDKLIDLLLIDLRYFDEAIAVDLTEYRFVFLLNYNSFISTRELLDKLAHRFINSGNAVISVMKKAYLHKHNNVYAGEFPNWNIDSSIDLSELGDVDYELLLKIQINILKVLIVLINNFYSNFATDLTNKKILIKLLKLFSNEILQWYNSNKIDASLEKSFESLVNYYKKLKKIFVKKTYRPIEVSKFDDYLVNEFKFNNSLHEVPMNRNLPGHKNVSKIEKFLHKFNKLLAVFYKGIKSEDWIRVFKVIENQFETHSLLDFDLQKPSTGDDTIVVSNVFTFFELLVDPVQKELVLKKLPLVFRKLFKLYYKFRSYLLIQLTDLNITVDERLDRMKTLLIMAKISKLKMSDNQFVFEGDKDNIPSCVESAITNVIYLPESRSFTNLWLKAASGLNDSEPTSLDDLHNLLPDLKHLDLIMTNEPLLPCFGWIIENLIETNKCPSFFRANIINFNKRYLIYKLIKELSVEDIDSPDEVNYHDTREFEFLLKLDETLINNQHLKDFTSLDRDKTKLFRTVLRDQHKILLIDNKKKQMREARDPTLLAANGLVTPLNKKLLASSLRRQSLSYKLNLSSRFKISGIFGKNRPFSGLNGPDRVVSTRELPAVEQFNDVKQKPFAVVPLKNKKIFPVYLLPLCFKIDSETSSDDFFFQATSEAELNDWLVKLNYANRHWFYSRTINLKNNHAFTTFGIPISVICNREQTFYPRMLSVIFEEIENEGIKDVGVYRISSLVSELNNIKSIIDKTGTITFTEKAYDVHTLTSCVKSFFRELPDALLTDAVIDGFFALLEEEKQSTDKIREVIRVLPSVNYHTLNILLKHLKKVSEYSNDNKMTASNLATVIGPALTEALSHESLVNNFGFMNLILEKLIVNYDTVFDDSY